MSLIKAPVSASVAYVIRRSLKQNFRRICWVGPPPPVPPAVPLVMYANHHSFYDGYLLWYVIDHFLKRPALTWMAEWDRFPLFAALGAQPFPPDDPKRRMATIRRTAHYFSTRPECTLFYFPEAHLHAPEEGIYPFSSAPFFQLDRIFPEKQWLPVAIHITWHGESKPTALITAGSPHGHATGNEHQQLLAAWNRLREPTSEHMTVLLEGKRSPNEGVSLGITRKFFSRYLNAP